MSLFRLRILPSALALAAAATLAAGCSATPQSTPPTSTGSTEATPKEEPTGPMPSDIEAAWLDGGRSFAIVTWGSSSRDCQPAHAEATADGQVVSVTLADPANADVACTADLVPRAIPVAVPDGVDVTKDVELRVTYGEVADDVDLDALDAAPQGPGDQQPSAGWFDDRGIVLLTYGSSSCPPQVEAVDQAEGSISVTFASVGDRVCTMDFASRLTVITLQDERDDDTRYTLTFTGDGLDGTVDVIG